jgi:hypothetical protein
LIFVFFSCLTSVNSGQLLFGHFLV